MTLVDSSVLLDIVTDDPNWAAWSQMQLERAAMAGPVWINDIVYAEVSARFASIEAFDAILATMEMPVAPMPRPALFMAAKVYRRYRSQGGTRTGVLSDFFIGAHAAVQNYALLTRRAKRLADYFPTLRLIVPAGSDH